MIKADPDASSLSLVDPHLLTQSPHLSGFGTSTTSTLVCVSFMWKVNLQLVHNAVEIRLLIKQN